MQSKRRWLPRWQRVELVELCLQQGMTRRQAAEWRRVSVSTVQFWVDRSRRPRRRLRLRRARGRQPAQRPHTSAGAEQREVHDRVCEARERTGWGPRLIASELGMSHATVSRCLQRRGLSRRPATERDEVRRFEWPCPGDLLQMDTKQFPAF